MAETDWHRELMFDLIKTLQFWFRDQPMIYVSGNLLMFYEMGNRRKHVSPDVFVVRGVPNHQRGNYLIWKEGKTPDVVFELTSSSTRSEDLKTKFRLYRDVLKVSEYFLFDPLDDYLKPPMQGFRLSAGEYVPIEPKHGRLSCETLGLLLERVGTQLRLVDPDTGRMLLTPVERAMGAEEAARLAAALQAELDQLRNEVKRLRKRRKTDTP